MAKWIKPPDVVAPCGCRLSTDMTPDGPVVTMYPHDLMCPMVNASIDAAIGEDKTVKYIK